MSSKNTIGAVAVAFDVLRTIADNRAPMRQAEIASALNINRAQALRYCETLTQSGALEQVGGAYALGPAMARLYARFVARRESQIAAMQRDIDTLEE
jgi:DNA-binding IclR family transcriptional regulator